MRRRASPVEDARLVRATPVDLPSKRPDIEERLREQAGKYVENSVPENTRRSYENDFKQFASWCDSMGYQPLPASEQTIGLYITSMATGELVGDSKRVTTIRRAMSAIAKWHIRSGYQSPVTVAVKALYSGIARTHREKAVRKQALLREDLGKIVERTTMDLQGMRDVAMVLVGWHAAMRREEIERMRRSWLSFRENALIITIDGSKTNQMGFDRIVVKRTGTDICPVAAMERWIKASDVADGYVFCSFTNKQEPLFAQHLTGSGIARIVKRLVKHCEIGDPTFYSGHSMRRGFVTQMHADKVPLVDIMAVTRHKSYDNLRKYIQDIDVEQEAGKEVAIE